ncbi:Uncharacterized protein FWK35_00019435 [Aphis craccivora]|uniref:Tudor domain-containing protein n=1 Tax=Aphis craccivora TaxID=307492 RepID=A0A6G0Y9D0_APHCR|nr:Uncharacterized protein FWK35_00019435 [Aphis craccivora]
MKKDCNYEICMVDSTKKLLKNGFINLCKKYGPVKNITIHKTIHENQAFIQFEDNDIALQILNEKSSFPSFITVNLSNRTQKMMDLLIEKENNEDVKNCESNNISKISVYEDESKKNETGASVYIGPDICGKSLMEEYEKFKTTQKIPYNLENDDLFGRPLGTKWEEIKKPEFEINNLDFYKRFENCTDGEIKIGKKLSPSTFTGLTTIFNNGENVQAKLKIISNDIENSDILIINNLKYGMLVGAFDNATNLYGRGYVTLVAGNSVNVALSDYGRVINTMKLRVLPTKYTQLPAYAFKVHTKGDYVPQLIKTSYNFKVCSVSPERIVLILFDENKEIKVQLKKWQPTIEESGVPYVDFKSNSSVELLKLKYMDSAFIRSKEKHHFEFFFSCWNNLAAYCYKNVQYLDRKPVYGEIVGFKSTLTKNFVRGRVHKYLGGDLYSVKHMDDPFKENIKSCEMILLQFEHKIIPVSVLKVGLNDALPYPVQYDAKMLVNNVSGIRFIVKFDESKADGWKHVDLTIKSLRENFNIILYGLVEPSWLIEDVVDNPRHYFTYTDLLRTEFVEKSVLKMTFVLYHDGVFYMRDKLFGKSFSVLSDMIREYCGLNLSPYLPHINEVCLGLFPDGLWYRVICDQLKPGLLVKVHSIDLGIVAHLNTRNLKKLPAELLFEPTHVALCLLDSSIPINGKNLELLKDHENTDCEMTVVKSLGGKNHYSINCPFLENILQ